MYYYSNTVCVILLGGDTNLYDIKGYYKFGRSYLNYDTVETNSYGTTFKKGYAFTAIGCKQRIGAPSIKQSSNLFIYKRNNFSARPCFYLTKLFASTIRTFYNRYASYNKFGAFATYGKKNNNGDWGIILMQNNDDITSRSNNVYFKFIDKNNNISPQYSFNPVDSTHITLSIYALWSDITNPDLLSWSKIWFRWAGPNDYINLYSN